MIESLKDSRNADFNFSFGFPRTRNTANKEHSYNIDQMIKEELHHDM